MGKYLEIAQRVRAAAGGAREPAPPTMGEPASDDRLWWELAPWYGSISDEEFRAIVAAYIARHGSYTPDLPREQPAVLIAWIAGRTQ